MNTITRTRLVEATEAGIEAARDILTPAEKIALRTVAATTQTVAIGMMGTQECGCPLVKIGTYVFRDGIRDECIERSDPDDFRDLAVFYMAFDRAAARGQNGEHTVVD